MPAAALSKQGHLHPVALEHRDGGPAGGRIVELDGARGKERHARSGLRDRRLAPVEPGREGLSMEGGQLPVLVDAHDGLHQRALWRQRGRPVGYGRGQAPEAPDQLGVSEEAILERYTLLPGFGRARAEHEPRKVDLPAVRRRVRAVVVAELALVAEVYDLLDVLGRELLDVPVHRVDVEAVEQHLEGRTQRQAAPAAAADVVHAAKLRVHGVELPELCPPYVQCHGGL